MIWGACRRFWGSVVLYSAQRKELSWELLSHVLVLVLKLYIHCTLLCMFVIKKQNTFNNFLMPTEWELEIFNTFNKTAEALGYFFSLSSCHSY